LKNFGFLKIDKKGKPKRTLIKNIIQTVNYLGFEIKKSEFKK